MGNVIRIILVNHNPQIDHEVARSINASGIICEVKNVVNGGHALLHLIHLHLYDRIEKGPIFILLNLHTPVINGFEFLKEFELLKDFKKDHISIVVISNGLNSIDKSKAEELGVLNFVPASLSPGFLKKISTA